MLAPLRRDPDPEPTEVEAADDVRASLRKTLANLRERNRTGRLNEDSRLFKLKKKLTEYDDAEAVERRRAMLLEHELNGNGAAAKNGNGAADESGVSRIVIPDAVPD